MHIPLMDKPFFQELVLLLFKIGPKSVISPAPPMDVKLDYIHPKLVNSPAHPMDVIPNGK